MIAHFAARNIHIFQDTKQLVSEKQIDKFFRLHICHEGKCVGIYIDATLGKAKSGILADILGLTAT